MTEEQLEEAISIKEHIEDLQEEISAWNNGKCYIDNCVRIDSNSRTCR